MTEYTIRDATEQDVLDTVLAVKQFCKEIPHPAWGKFDANKVKQLVSNLVEHELGFVKIVIHNEHDTLNIPKKVFTFSHKKPIFINCKQSV